MSSGPLDRGMNLEARAISHVSAELVRKINTSSRILFSFPFSYLISRGGWQRRWGVERVLVPPRSATRPDASAPQLRRPQIASGGRFRRRSGGQFGRRSGGRFGRVECRRRPLPYVTPQVRSSGQSSGCSARWLCSSGMVAAGVCRSTFLTVGYGSMVGRVKAVADMSTQGVAQLRTMRGAST